jgi:serine/threonine protein kinase
MNRTTPLPMTVGCPSAEQLRAFAVAGLPHDCMDVIELHVVHCESCMNRLESWDEQSDALVQALATLPSGADDELAFQNLQSELLSTREPMVGPDSPTVSFANTLTATAGELPEQIGGYRLLSLIGRGATGAVYRARHLKLDRIVAVKVLNTGCVGHDPQAVQRFQLEMRAVGQLDHPNIVRATDAGEEGGYHYLVMDYVEGIDVSRLLRLVGPLRVADACEIVRQAAVALQFAHEHKMVHRDIKPSNLLFTFAGQIKLLDLGLVRNDGQPAELGALWQASIPHGTADYMPPEQWTNFADADARADIYSLGCTLYKLLSGQPVYPRPHAEYGAKMDAHLSAPVPLIRHQRPEVPLGLQKVLCRMLAKRPSDRYDTAADVAQRLEPYAEGARIKELGLHVNSLTLSQIQRSFAEDTASVAVVPHVRTWLTRRRLLVTAASMLPLAAVVWRGWPHSVPRLRVGQWRSLRPTEPPLSFPRSIASGREAAQSHVSAEPGQPLKMSAQADTLFELGQPIRGPFALRFRFSCLDDCDRIGVFFKYRPHKTEAAVVHPFQVIELARSDTDGYRLLWSHYLFHSKPHEVFGCEYTPWAEVSTAAPVRRGEAELEVTLGRTGFPEVRWNGDPLSEGRWTLSWQARHMSQLTRDELQRAYLGRLGVFARSATATFSQLQLCYLDEQEIL